MGDALQQGRISVRPLEVPGAGRAFPFGVQAAFALLTLATLAAGALSFLLFWAAFWFLGESVRLALHVPRPLAPAWLIVPALLATAGALFLATDRLAMLGSAAARETLRDKAKRFFAPWEPPRGACFVEARVTGGDKSARMDLDLGCLFLLPGRLLFVGDYHLLEVPRDAVRGKPRADRDLLGLAAPYLSVPLADGRRLRLLCREDATRQSGTASHTLRLEAALARWLADDGYAEATDSQPSRAAER